MPNFDRKTPVASQSVLEMEPEPIQMAPIPAQGIFTVDVEDWFHILDTPATPRFDEWCKLPSLVEPNFNRLLDLFDEKKVKVTCFFLGWVAERFPQLVKDAA